MMSITNLPSNLLVCFVLALYLLPAWAQTCGSSSLGFDAVYDLENGVTCSVSSAITNHTSFTGSGCSRRGVIKLALDSSTRRKVLLDLHFTSPSNWVFNLGDSSTNNGWAGDSGTTTYDAEVQGLGTSLSGWKSDVGGSGNSFTKGNAYANRLILVAENGRVTWASDTSFNVVADSGLFALNGQDNNNDLYLGVNRVVAGAYRSGSGLCRVGIKFYP